MEFLSRCVQGAIRRLGLRPYFRTVEFAVMRRDLAEPDFRTPRGRKSKLGDPATFQARSALPADLDLVAQQFPPRKVRHFRRMLADPNVDIPFRGDHDKGMLWCYMMHAQHRHRESEYGFVFPLVEGRDILQFDGWVNPEHRGYLLGIAGVNYGARCRRAEGFERIYAAVRTMDERATRFHTRIGYREVGRIRHRQFGPFQWNRISFDAGEHPEENREPRGIRARLGVVPPREAAPQAGERAVDYKSSRLARVQPAP